MIKSTTAIAACALAAVIGYGGGFVGDAALSQALDENDVRYVAPEVLEHARDACVRDAHVTAGLDATGDAITTPNGNAIQSMPKNYTKYLLADRDSMLKTEIADTANKYLSAPVEDENFDAIYVMREPVATKHADASNEAPSANATLTCLVDVADVAEHKNTRAEGLRIYTDFSNHPPQLR